jgi:major membrane immunogen (membrane-anchored lipoprotein)
MKRLASVLLAALLCFGILAACGDKQKVYSDGIYRAEYTEPDTWGYRDFVVVTVRGGVVEDLMFDAVNDSGALRSEDTAYREDMEELQGTYPKKYSQDLVIQYLEQQDVEQIDVIANATESSNKFIALFAALEPQMRVGNTEIVHI